MESIIKRVQEYLVREYRNKYPEFKAFSNEEVVLLNPISEYDLRLFIAYEKSQIDKALLEIDTKIAEYKEEIEFATETLNDPNSFSEAKSEANRDISYANKNITLLTPEKNKFLRRLEQLVQYEKQDTLMPQLTEEQKVLEIEKIRALIAKIDAMIADYEEDLAQSKVIKESPHSSVVDKTDANNDIVYDTVRIHRLNMEKDKLKKRLVVLGWDEDEKRGR